MCVCVLCVREEDVGLVHLCADTCVYVHAQAERCHGEKIGRKGIRAPAALYLILFVPEDAAFIAFRKFSRDARWLVDVKDKEREMLIVQEVDGLGLPFFFPGNFEDVWDVLCGRATQCSLRGQGGCDLFVKRSIDFSGLCGGIIRGNRAFRV